MSNFEKVAIRGEQQLPLKFIPAGTLLFTYGRLQPPMTVQAAYAEQLRQTGQFQNISWDNDTREYVICFSENVNKPLYFSPFPGLGFGIAGRNYNIAHVCRTSTGMWVGHMRSGTLMDPHTYKKPQLPPAPQLPEARRILRCEPQGAQQQQGRGCVPLGRVAADYCVARRYGMDNEISGTTTIDPVDCIIDAAGLRREMFNALRNFYQAARVQGFPGNFREMWNTMMLGISADKTPNPPNNTTIGYEEYVINTPYGYENYNLDFIPNRIIGIDADLQHADRKIFRVPEARFLDFRAACRSFKKPYITYEASATVNGINGHIHLLPDVLPNHTYALNMNLWSITERNNGLNNRDLNYLPNKGILWRENPSIRNIIVDPPHNILLNTLDNARRVTIEDLWKIKSLNDDPSIEDAAMYRVLKIMVGDRVRLRAHSLEHVLVDTHLGQKSIQVGPVNDYFSGRDLPIPDNDPFDSINTLRVLLGTIETDAACQSHVYQHSTRPFIAVLRGPGALVEDQRSEETCPGPMPIAPIPHYNGGGYLRNSRKTRVKKTKSKKSMIRTRKNHRGGAGEDERSERVYEAEALTGETFELAKELEKYLLEDSLISQKEYLEEYAESKRLQAIIDASVSTTNTPVADVPNTNTPTANAPNTNALAVNKNARAAVNTVSTNALAVNRNARAAVNTVSTNALAVNRNAPANRSSMKASVGNTIQ
jgi:hypothetical protein